MTQASITRDLTGMARNGFGGVMIIDAGGAEQQRNRPIPNGPMFGSPEWRVLFRHALSEAKRLGLEVSLNILSGWNLGGPTNRLEIRVTNMWINRVRGDSDCRRRSGPLGRISRAYRLVL